MNLEIKYVKDSGDIKKERIVLSVIENDDVGRYILFDTTYVDDTSVSNKIRHSFWFPDKDVKKGDVIVVYTKRGTNTQSKNKDDSTSHFFYMDLENSIWNEDGDTAVIIEVFRWSFKKVH